MSTVPTPEVLKNKAKAVRKFLSEKYNVDVSHGHCLDLVSGVFGFKDWNTASAKLKAKAKQAASPSRIKTVGELRRALASFSDSDTIDAMYEFKVKELQDSIDPLAHPEDTIIQEFSLSLEPLSERRFDEEIASLKLNLENEDLSLTSFDLPLKEDCGFYKTEI